MTVRFPRPLREGDTIGVTAPSSGVAPPMEARLEVALAAVRARGFEVELGECLLGDGVVSAPKEARAAELTRMLADPRIAAVVPPWGGELAVDLLDQLDWDHLATLEPTWVVGFSDTTSVLLPLTTRLGWATLHGHNLMDTPYAVHEGLLGWIDTLTGPSTFTQTSPGRFRTAGWDDYVGDPGVTRMSLDGVGDWSLLDPAHEGCSFSGRLVGGCIDVLGPLAGTPYGDVRAFARTHAPEGTVVLLEAAEQGALDVCRALHAMRLAGWFEGAAGVLVGRTSAPAVDGFTQRDAVADALGMLGVPVVLDVEHGHVQPFAALVAGALAHVDTAARTITQTLA